MVMDGSEVLRRVAAARLSNNSAPHQARQSKNAPRSLPAQAATSPPRATTAEGQVTPKVGTPAPCFNADASSSAGPITERNTNTMAADKGSVPSLKGNPESLKEARDFLQAASKTKVHSRTPRAALSVPSASSGRSAREPRAQKMLSESIQGVISLSSPVSRAPKAETTPLFAENVRPAVSKWADFSAIHNKPVSLQNTPDPAFTSNESYTSLSGHSTPSTAAAGTSKSKTDSVDDITSALRSTSITGDSPGAKSGPKTQTKGAGLFDRQLSGVNNTLKDLDSEMLPPHLRGKALNQGLSTKPSKPVGKTAENANGANLPIAPETPFSATAKAPQPMLPAAAPAATSSAKARSEVVAAGISAESEVCQKQSDGPPLQETKKPSDSPGKKADPIVLDADIFDNPKATQSTMAGVDGDGSGIFAKMQMDVKELSEKVKSLETAKVEMEHRLEQLVKKDEQRRFMGTGDINAPFAIDVAYPDGTKRAIQVSVGMKVADLIKRCRVDAKIEAGTTRNPRIAVDGSFIGHGQLLGEVNVTKGTNKFVAFQYELV
ncbi:hypothetical protein KC332_g7188 [Hortaea werneckii]|uniref:Uncharacterized protein n=2 Tax=Hortaea werneckii TaxID=91943 RepID=A0A3M7JD30_HORWE|nr:hypothetical protein KC350_g8606 [Hortaea werneckii]OTA28859.1 hypothetical protein BTJ68_08383 [Hortaea werneckii EXF-2000]KAI6830476.1 hypothetical protein KC358_g6792 [Hortaea werneckii]KAI6931346.1 hypothetical protein KC348_g7290 [Hortaea werneckii]KAI6935873.1 hypothetical protein KC341_g6611 [Hortaea werneckii]